MRSAVESSTGAIGSPDRLASHRRCWRQSRALSPLAPLHNPTDAAVLDAAARRAPDVPAVAVFDTVFHRTLPEVAWRYAQERQIARNAVALLRGENTGPGGQ
jgi:Acetokinase family